MPHRVTNIAERGRNKGFLKDVPLCPLRTGKQRPNAERAKRIALQTLIEHLISPLSPLSYVFSEADLRLLLNPLNEYVRLSREEVVSYIITGDEGKLPLIVISLKQVNDILDFVLRQLKRYLGYTANLTEPSTCELIASMIIMVLVLHELYHEAFKTEEYAKKLASITIARILNESRASEILDACPSLPKQIPSMFSNKKDRNTAEDNCVKNFYTLISTCSSIMMNSIHDIYANSLAFHETLRIINEMLQGSILLMKISELIFEYVNSNLITVNSIGKKLSAFIEKLENASREKAETIERMLINPFNVNIPNILYSLSDLMLTKQFLELLVSKKSKRLSEKNALDICIKYFRGG